MISNSQNDMCKLFDLNRKCMMIKLNISNYCYAFNQYFLSFVVVHRLNWLAYGIVD